MAVSLNKRVGWVLRVYISDDVSPGEHSEDLFSNTGVDRGAILGVPNNEGVVAAHSCEVTIVRAKRELFYTFEHALKHSNWFASFVVPENNRGLRGALE